MCKVFAMTNMAHVPLTAEFISVVKRATTVHDDDGFGYAVSDIAGNLFGERSIDVSGFKALAGNKPAALPRIADPVSNAFGTLPANPAQFIAHGRLSTNTKSLGNTHPFVSDHDDIALIHNGVVSTLSDEITLRTDCDTEILLRHWEEYGLDAILDHVSGYFAVAILQDGLLHIIRDDRAPLYIARVDGIDSFIIATTKDIIETVCKDMGWTVSSSLDLIRDCSHTVFDGNAVSSFRVFPALDKFQMSSEELRAFESLEDSLDTAALEYDDDTGYVRRIK